MIAVKPAELSTARAAPAVAAAVVVEAAGRGEAAKKGLAIAAAAAAIYRLVYSHSSLYSANTYQHIYLLGLKSHMEAAQPYAGRAWRSDGS